MTADRSIEAAETGTRSKPGPAVATLEAEAADTPPGTNAIVSDCPQFSAGGLWYVLRPPPTVSRTVTQYSTSESAPKNTQ